ncbi:MAG: polymer-forming cytoskeletal protein [Terrimonas sp.]|uniref:bactofilin family protein n=1 Tax=Terrimonas sp. TaxID=1914338 RepID=UPI00092CCB19|nr:polymer-forming cytoskeletal protein [Terrimonas sp.]MBN8786758.1 polymer-forming cytoskeletal protein [Terrimonas sp.]OJY98133.1 MAG: cell shape determination protein CcmA [Sphingobacteriales bacterium 40-81]PVD49743.1 cell shape determination protein CcmA [Terrimonas sp.]PVD49943.1 cell shape determination protein CcmA [Terrimonas sp.]
MFSSKSRSDIEINPSSSSTSLIGAGTIIKGDIISNGDIRIDGTLKGNISGSAKVLIGAEGVIEGDVEGQQADILGKVSGKILIKDLLNLRGKAIIKGNISAGKLQVEPTVTFKGQCHVGEGTVADVVEMKEEEPIAKAK